MDIAGTPVTAAPTDPVRSLAPVARVAYRYADLAAYLLRSERCGYLTDHDIRRNSLMREHTGSEARRLKQIISSHLVPRAVAQDANKTLVANNHLGAFLKQCEKSLEERDYIHLLRKLAAVLRDDRSVLFDGWHRHPECADFDWILKYAPKQDEGERLAQDTELLAHLRRQRPPGSSLADAISDGIARRWASLTKRSKPKAARTGPRIIRFAERPMPAPRKVTGKPEHRVPLERTRPALGASDGSYMIQRPYREPLGERLYLWLNKREPWIWGAFSALMGTLFLVAANEQAVMQFLHPTSEVTSTFNDVAATTQENPYQNAMDLSSLDSISNSSAMSTPVLGNDSTAVATPEQNIDTQLAQADSAPRAPVTATVSVQQTYNSVATPVSSRVHVKRITYHREGRVVARVSAEDAAYKRAVYAAAANPNPALQAAAAKCRTSQCILDKAQELGTPISLEPAIKTSFWRVPTLRAA